MARANSQVRTCGFESSLACGQSLSLFQQAFYHFADFPKATTPRRVFHFTGTITGLYLCGYELWNGCVSFCNQIISHHLLCEVEAVADLNGVLCFLDPDSYTHIVLVEILPGLVREIDHIADGCLAVV